MVQLIPKTDAQLIESLASNATELVIMPLNAELTAVPTLPKIQGNLPGFVVEAEHPRGRGFTARRQINEATEIPEAKSNERSDLDIVRLMEAYRLSNNSPQTSLK